MSTVDTYTSAVDDVVGQCSDVHSGVNDGRFMCLVRVYSTEGGVATANGEIRSLKKHVACVGDCTLADSFELYDLIDATFEVTFSDTCHEDDHSTASLKQCGSARYFVYGYESGMSVNVSAHYRGTDYSGIAQGEDCFGTAYCPDCDILGSTSVVKDDDIQCVSQNSTCMCMSDCCHTMSAYGYTVTDEGITNIGTVCLMCDCAKTVALDDFPVCQVTMIPKASECPDLMCPDDGHMSAERYSPMGCIYQTCAYTCYTNYVRAGDFSHGKRDVCVDQGSIR